MSWGLLAALDRPSWVVNRVTRYVWSFWMRRVLGKTISGQYHKNCLPEGWRFWTLEFTQDLTAIHSLGVEEELTKAIADQLKRERTYE